MSRYKLVRLPNGTHTVYSFGYGEKMHPGLGPTAEAELLYVNQLRLRERLAQHHGDFVVWDVGLGAAANAIAVLRAARDYPGPLQLISFDDTLEPLAFALSHVEALGYLSGYEVPVKALLEGKRVQFTNGRCQMNWQLHLNDFPALLTHTLAQSPPQTLSAPHDILFDAFSPAKNPAMWTLPLFTNLFRLLDPARPCNLTTYSRSTMFRVTLLLAGFFVGRGVPTGLKEETTVAANTLELIDEPLDRKWLERARRSDSAEPLHDRVYRRAPLEPGSWEKLQQLEQFAH